tara:strand:+ start:2389 stop:5676 length:3288 start_codon:yes stop_codon:yes gene_type:complete
MLKNKYYNHQNFSYSLKKDFETSDKPFCVFVKDNKEAIYLKNELNLIINDTEILLFPENDILPYDHFSVPEKITKQRFKIINEINQSKNILITTVKNLFDQYPTKEYFKSKNDFSIGTNISLNELINIIESLNYQKKINVENINEYSIRGGIIDIYTPIYADPLRIEIFDDVIESIRFFDVDSQLSIKNIKTFSISQGDVISLNSVSTNKFIDEWREYFVDTDERYCPLFQKIKTNQNVEGKEVYLPFFFNETTTFFDLFKNYEFVKFEDLSDQIKSYKEFIDDRYEDESMDKTRPLIKPSDLYVHSDEVYNFITNTRLINVETFNSSYINANNMISDFENHGKTENKYILMSASISKLEEIKNNLSLKNPLISDLNNLKDSFNLMHGDVIRPIFLKNINLFIFHNEDLAQTITLKKENKNDRSSHIELNQSFDKDELVIHDDYGLGIYKGLDIVKANNQTNEYIKISYANNENLYVPLNKLNKLSTYHKKGAELKVQLDSLSSTKWYIKKTKAKKRAQDHAAEILEIESRRLASNSTSLNIDSGTLKDFEDDFPYMPTDDQITAFNSIRADLRLVKPMNRVLCGDVGFGKTEVAMKSSFISVNSNKQVIIITPSTILCNQHYDSFLNRFTNFGVNIKKLNRFVSKKDKEKIISDFNSQKIDILISTHIVFNNDINTKNVGLLIIDEEHKFGIKQKNYIKNKQENIHILYLSATPIPRTMNMVFSGLKEFSFLQTPPSNRISIKSFLKIQTNQLLKEALSREKARGGQCFIVQNDIYKIKSIEAEIKILLPDYKVGIAHGRLKKKEINDVMSDFKSGQIDGLICTTIVEMGLDIPNANTMLIINSQNFGLSQLHQLRGRVGRSEKQGYCYFLIPDIEIPKVSRARLDSIIKNSNLGEGFMIAQEDLELRGGGEMLGDKQSGHIDSVGISLYLSMLKEAINKTKGDNKFNSIKPEVNFNDSSFISSSYLPSPVERLKVYRKISNSYSINKIEEIEKNLIDRCGIMPLETKNLLDNNKISIRIHKTGIRSIKSNKINTNLELENIISDNLLTKILELVKVNNNSYKLTNDNKLIYKDNAVESELRRNNVNLLLDELL